MRCFQQSEVNVLILLDFKRAARHRFLCAASVFFRLRGHLVFFCCPCSLLLLSLQLVLLKEAHSQTPTKPRGVRVTVEGGSGLDSPETEGWG